MAQQQQRHHLVPKHAGGGDEALNLTPPISLRLHAMFHYDRWKALGESGDYVAWRAILHGPPTAPFADRKHTAATRAKMSDAHLGLKESTATRELKRAAALGKPKSEEHLAALHKSYDVRTGNKAWRQRLSAAQVAFYATLSDAEKAARNKAKGRAHTDDEKRAHAEKMRAWWANRKRTTKP